MYIVTLLDLESWTENDIYADECLLVKSDVSGQILATTPSEDGELRVCSKEIQCGATFGHALARVSPSRMRPPVACAYSIGGS